MPGGDPAGRRAGPGDESDDRHRPAKGVFIIHAPSSCMDNLQRPPGPERAQSAPEGHEPSQHIGEWCNKIPAEEKGTYPIDQSDGGCDDGPQCPQGSPWKSQVAAIAIKDDDAISDSGARSGTCSKAEESPMSCSWGSYQHVRLGRPFGLRNLARPARTSP